MTETTENKAQSVEQAQEQEQSLLEMAVAATKQTKQDRAQQLLATFTQAALSGCVTFDKNLTYTIQSAIENIDKQLSKQLAAVMHSEKLKKIEGSWRGLQYLVSNSLINGTLKIRVMNVDKKTLSKDFSKSLEFDQSDMFKKLYESEYGTAGGEPYGLVIGDYEFGKHPDDMELLENISHVAAAGFSPFVSSTAPSLLGMDKWSDLSKPRDLEKIFDSPEYLKWNGIRNSEDSRFVSLVMPRVLARQPYGAQSKAIEEFAYEEAETDANGKIKALDHEDYCWMNAAYVMGTRMTASFSEFSWCTSIRGAENGGKVEGLPAHVFTSDDGDIDFKCPTEIGITDRREAELSNLGFLPLCHYKNTDYAVFFGGQTIQKPITYDNPDATANANISARLPYIMATSRFAHYLKVMARDKIGSFLERKDAEVWLNQWVLNYVNGNGDAGPRTKAKYPLAEAKIQVVEVPGKPGSYNAIAWLRPWLQMEELTASLRMVARIPALG